MCIKPKHNLSTITIPQRGHFSFTEVIYLSNKQSFAANSTRAWSTKKKGTALPPKNKQTKKAN